MFKLFDKNSTSNISANIFRHVLTTLGDRLTEDEVAEMVVDHFKYILIIGNEVTLLIKPNLS